MKTMPSFSDASSHVKRAIIMVLLGAIVSLMISLFQPFEYRTEVKVLIIRRSDANFDPYLAVKSAERIGESLREIMFTSSFIQKVQNSGALFPDGYFPTDARQLKKQWKRALDVKVIPETNVMEIAVFDEDAAVSRVLAEAVSTVLVEQGSEYHGASDQILMKIVDAPLSSHRPVRPNIFLYGILGSLSGLGIFVLFLVFQKQDDFKSVLKNVEAQEEAFSMPQVEIKPEVGAMPMMRENSALTKPLIELDEDAVSAMFDNEGK